MDKEQKDLLTELVRVERRRLNNALRKFNVTGYTFENIDEAVELRKEIEICNQSLFSLQGGK